jgi:hypothetical protein
LKKAKKEGSRKILNPGVVEEQQSGYGQTPMLEAIPTHKTSKNECLVPGSGITNSFIIFGKDRPGDIETGWGAEPKTGAARIDLIAGLSGVAAKETNEKGEDLGTSPNPYLDSARIYMTQQAKDIDSEEYFHIADGKVGRILNESAIVVKADSVRVIGRKGIKIVTGSDKYAGGSGFFVGDDIPGIDLIAGNNDKDLQPMVKGDDLQRALLEMHEMHKQAFEFIVFIFKLQMKHLSITLPNPYMAASIPAIIKTLGTDGVELISKLAKHQLNSVFFKYNIGAPTDEPALLLARALLKPAFDFRSKHNNVN